MCFKIAVITLACLGGLTARRPPYLEEERHVSNTRRMSRDNVPAATNQGGPAATNQGDPAAAIHAASKHFQDIYVAMEKPNELQFGHVSETPSEWQQRFEKIDLANLQRQGKVRWGDKHGGYGEHYWDFNHGGPQESRQVPQQAAHVKEIRPASAYAQILNAQRGKREQGLLKDVEFISDKARSLILDGSAPKHGGNYRTAEDYRGKREEQKISEEDLIFEPESASLFDRKSGFQYGPKPIRD